MQPGSHGGFQKLFFGREEIAIPQYGTIEEAVAKHPRADVLVNFASYRSAYESSFTALRQPTIRVVAIIAEGVPERDTKELIAYASANRKVIIGPATVGGVQVGTQAADRRAAGVAPSAAGGSAGADVGPSQGLATVGGGGCRTLPHGAIRW